MIKNHHRRKLSRTSAHRRSLLRNMATSLFREEKVATTVAKAKELVPFAEHLITLARPGTVNARRAVSREIKDAAVTIKIFEVLVPRYQARNGGYTRTFKLGTRRGDSASMALVKLIS
jgi:large subunit ribosomal protein L17